MNKNGGRVVSDKIYPDTKQLNLKKLIMSTLLQKRFYDDNREQLLIGSQYEYMALI